MESRVIDGPTWSSPSSPRPARLFLSLSVAKRLFRKPPPSRTHIRRSIAPLPSRQTSHNSRRLARGTRGENPYAFIYPCVVVFSAWITWCAPVKMDFLRVAVNNIDMTKMRVKLRRDGRRPLVESNSSGDRRM
ncbi:hypothetical protein CEXT_374101 [Caerostris extrusa]|uniref:Uncharacterized protein n=1 Tax=Caerostris extrusa TaxID=172846 RepID=A0AAV4YCP7_CAEEX|nr:hypothetical protein CEXT_374101 [Caerostris extrusa]